MKLTASLVAAWCLFYLSSAPLLAQEAVASEPVPEARSTSTYPKSGLSELDPSPLQQVHLWTLGKVWGFLKYHHPALTQGEVDWDHELLRILPPLLAAGSEEAGRSILAGWAESFPAPDHPLRAAREPREAHLLPDLDWIHDADVLGESLCAYLAAVHAARHGEGDQRYVRRGPGAGNPIFDGEQPYADLEQVDAGYRLLALYRFWNVIEWWSPYRDLLDDDWDDVLREFIPRFLACETREAYGLELVALSGLVKDTHTNIWSMRGGVPPSGPAVLPVTLRFVDGQAVVSGVPTGVEGETESLQLGDALLSIGGHPVEEMVKELAPLYPASNQPARLRGMARALGRGEPGDVALRILRDGREIELTTPRVAADRQDLRASTMRDLPGPAFRLLHDDIAYVKLSSAEVSEVDRYMEEAKGTKGLIIDIRNYPREFMILYELGGHLVIAPTAFATFTRPDLTNPGATVWEGVAQLTPKAPHYDGRVVILVDESSQSRAEFTAMAYQSAPGAIVVGSMTAGADGNASWFSLPGNHRSMISGIGVFYPDRSPTQRTGVAVDVLCHPTIQGIREGRDELLEEAIRQIRGSGR